MKMLVQFAPHWLRKKTVLSGCVLILPFAGLAGTTTNTWSGAGANDNWSTAGNWDGGAPNPSSTVFFTAADPAIDQFNANNIVDSSQTIDSLIFWDTNVWQTTQIPAGKTLTVNGSVRIPLYLGFTHDWVFFCGRNYQVPTATPANAAFLGEGALVVTNPAAAMSVRSYGAAAILDLSGLNSFDASVYQITVGCEGYTQAANQNRPAGILYLARTNNIRGYGLTNYGFMSTGLGIAIGENRANQGARSFVYLGITNVILANSGIEVGGARSLGTMQFNSLFSMPGVAYFRALDGVGRQSYWYIGDNNTSGTGTGSDGLADFTGGTVDALVDTVYVGRGFGSGTGAGTGVGMLLINDGRLDCNNLRIGHMRTTGGGAKGTVTLGGSASSTNLIVNNNIYLGYDIGNLDAIGTLDIASYVIVHGNIIDGGGQNNTVNLNAGTLSVGGKLGNNGGVNDQPLGALNLTSGTLILNLGSIGNPISPVCNVQNLTVGNITLNVEGSGLTPGIVPLIKIYGSGSFTGITQGTLPPKVSGSFSNTTDTLYLVITGVDTPKWKGNVNGDWDFTTKNWVTGVGGTSVAYQDGDSVLFDDTGLTATVNLTTMLSPNAIAVHNSTAKSYTFAGAGGLNGASSLSKQGSGTLTIANTGTNDFTGPVTLGAGVLQLSGTDNRLPTNGIINIADTPGVVFDLNNVNQQLTTVFGGGSSGGNIALGTGRLTLVGNGSQFAGVISGQGSVLKAGSGTQTLSGANTYSGGTVIGTNGTLILANTSGSGIGTGPVLIDGGTLQIGNGGPGGSVSQTVITNNGTLVLNQSDDMVFNKTITGTGDLNKSGTNVVSLAPGNSYTGVTAINNGAVRITDPSALSTNRITISGIAAARLELTNNVTVTQSIQISAKPTSAAGAPHIRNLGGTNVLAGPLEVLSSSEWCFQSDEGLLTINGPYTNSTAVANAQFALRGQGTGLWHASITDGTAGTSSPVTFYKRDDGTWILSESSQNTYSGGTLISGGTLVVNGAILNSRGISVGSGTTLAGGGSISSPVTNNSGGLLSPGNASIGTLTISNHLVCLAGSVCEFEVSGSANDSVRGLTSVTYGGTLRIVTNGVITGNATYKLFGATTYDGGFDYFDLPALPSPLNWDTNNIAVDGTLRIIGGVQIETFGLSAKGNFQLSGSGPATQGYRILGTTNVADSSSWIQLSTGTFDAGKFSYVDLSSTNYPRRFYRVVSP